VIKMEALCKSCVLAQRKRRLCTILALWLKAGASLRQILQRHTCHSRISVGLTCCYCNVSSIWKIMRRASGSEPVPTTLRLVAPWWRAGWSEGALPLSTKNQQRLPCTATRALRHALPVALIKRRSHHYNLLIGKCKTQHACCVAIKKIHCTVRYL